MIINIRRKPDFAEADRLIERYYDGLTTVDEEKQLRKFLMQSNLPERYQVEKDILGFYETKKQKAKVHSMPFARWSAAAAILVVCLLSVKVYTTATPRSFAYVNGKKITDVQEVKQTALASLTEISSADNEVADGLNSLHDNELIDQQLDIFTNN